MNCKMCRWSRLVLLLIALIFTVWPSLIAGIDGKWIAIVAILLLIIRTLIPDRMVCDDEKADVKKKK
jgi:hypothetical protein